MADYRAQVVAAAQGLPGPVALCGWSMGGLVVLQAAAEVQPDAVVLIEPSPPAEIQEAGPRTFPRSGLGWPPPRIYDRGRA